MDRPPCRALRPFMKTTATLAPRVLAAFFVSTVIIMTVLSVPVSPALAGGDPAAGLAAGPKPPAIDGDSAILMDLRTGQVLYSLRPDTREYPASTTKILTALIALEVGRLDDLVTAPDDILQVEGTRIYLEPGEKETLRDLLYAMLLNSANDAAEAVADHISGDSQAFATLMNQTAQLIGAKNSHFVNPSGLSDKDHYTTARDLAAIACYAMHNPTFAAMVGTKTYTMPWPEKGDVRRLVSVNHFLSRYDWATGVKPGYTSQAKETLVASASRDGIDLLAVILKSSSSTIWTDAAELMDYGFAVAPKKVTPVPPAQGLALAAAEAIASGKPGVPAAPPATGLGSFSLRPSILAWRGLLVAGVPLAAFSTLLVAWAVRRPRRRRGPGAGPAARRRRAYVQRPSAGRGYVHRNLYRPR